MASLNSSPSSGPLGASAPRGPLYLVLDLSTNADVAKHTKAIVSALRLSRQPFELLCARGDAELPAIAQRAVDLARRHQGAVVACGGDGTINTVARAVMSSGLPFGVLPQGPRNEFARAHGLPDDPHQAAAIWQAGCVRAVQVGEVNGQPFLVNASVGVHPRVVQARLPDRQFGQQRVVPWRLALRNLFTAPRLLRLMLASGRDVNYMQTPSLLVANDGLALRELGLDARDVGAGQLAAVRVKTLGPSRLLRQALQGARHAVGPVQEVASHLFRQLTVVPTGIFQGPRMQVGIDGDMRWMDAPLCFSVAAQPLLLLTPSRA